LKANYGNTLKFSPSPRAILFAKTHYIPNLSTYGNWFNFLDFAYYIKIHEKSNMLVDILFPPNAPHNWLAYPLRGYANPS